MNSNAVRMLFVMATTAAMTLSGCSGGGGGAAASGGSAIITHIKGQIGGTGGGGFFARSFRKAKQRFVSASSVQGCTVSAYTLTGTTPVATIQSLSGGIYTLTGSGLTAGVQYKIVADCTAVGGNVVSAVQGAATSDPTTEDPAPVNDTTTLIATEIVQAIITAVQNATKGLDPSIAAAIQQQILTPQVLANIVAVVTTTVQTAIDNGTMVPPSDGAASGLSNGIADTTTTSTLDGNGNLPAVTDYETTDTTTLPPVVTSAVSSVSSQAAAFPGCQASLNTDPSITGPVPHQDQYGVNLATLHKCQIAVAKMMNSVVHFDVAILMSGGAFDDYIIGPAGSPTQGIANCNNLDPVLLDAFPSATFTLSNSSNAPFNDGGQYCIVHNTTPVVNRNSSPNDYGNNDHNGLLCGETSASGTAYFHNGGIISAMGAALFNNGNASGPWNYHLSDIENIVFTPSATVTANVGMDARLVYVAPSFTWGPPNPNLNYNPQSNDLSLVAVSGTGASAVTTLAAWPSCAGPVPCPDPQHDNTDYVFTNNLWNSSDDATGTAAAIGASGFVGSVFFQKFGSVGGKPIPAEAVITQQLVNSTTHNDNNRSGQSTFYVLYKYAPSWNDPACQFSDGNTVVPTGNLTIAGTWASAGMNSLSLPDGTDGTDVTDMSQFNVGQSISGAGIPNGTFVTNVDQFNTALEISNVTSGPGASVPLHVTAATQCIAYDSVGEKWYTQPLVTVNLQMGPVDPKGYHHIAVIETPTDPTVAGKYYVMPAMTGGPFQGLVQFVDTTSGNVLLDDNLNPRFVQIIFDHTNQCGLANSGIPAYTSPGGACDNGYMFNVSVSWTCSSNSPCVSNLLKFSPVAALETPINGASAVVDANNTFYAMNLNYQVNQTMSQNGPGLVAAQFKPSGSNAGSNNFVPLAVTVNPSSGEIVSAALQSGSTPLGTNQWNIQQSFQCNTPGQPCTNNGYVLVNGSNYFQGVLSIAAGTYSGSFPGDLTIGGACSMSGCMQNVLVYNQHYFDTDISAVAWPWADGSGTDTFKRVAEQPIVNMGPAANPNWNCALDPYFLDVNNNGQLDVDDQGHCLEPTFGDVWAAGQYLNPMNGSSPATWVNVTDINFPSVAPLDQAHAKAQMLPNPSNSYVYGDPNSASALLHLAFGPMLSGTFILDDTVNLNALQAFGLIYMYFTSQSGSALYIQGIYTAPGSTNYFETETPSCNGGNNDDMCNAAIAGGITHFYQGGPQ